MPAANMPKKISLEEAFANPPDANPPKKLTLEEAFSSVSSRKEAAERVPNTKNRIFL